LAVYVIVVVPIVIKVPEIGLWPIKGTVHGPLALTNDVMSGMVAWQKLFTSTLETVGQTKVGYSSVTTKVVPQEAVLPDPSVAVMVIG
jgi:hypothetical protein